MIITISGTPGSGKTTVAKLLAKKLEYKHYSIGDLRGKMAIERNINIDELNELGEKEPWTDKDVDEYQKKLGETEDNLLFDGRLGFYFIPHSQKIFLKVDPRIGAERVFKDERPDETKCDSVEALMEKIEKRIESDRKRYEKWYNIDCWNEENYTLVINTTELSIEQVMGKILGFLEK